MSKSISTNTWSICSVQVFLQESRNDDDDLNINQILSFNPLSETSQWWSQLTQSKCWMPPWIARPCRNHSSLCFDFTSHYTSPLSLSSGHISFLTDSHTFSPILKHAGQTGLRAFAPAIPTAWKALSPDICVVSFLIVFWCLLKSCALREAFPATLPKPLPVHSFYYISLLYFFLST